MFSLRVLFALLALAVSSLPANAQSWQSLNGPTRPHEVLDIAIGKDANVQRIFAVDVDTMKVSTDGGRTWAATGASTYTAPLIGACKKANPSVAVVGKLGCVLKRGMVVDSVCHGVEFSEYDIRLRST